MDQRIGVEGNGMMKHVRRSVALMAAVSVLNGSAFALGMGSGCENQIHAPQDWVGLRMKWPLPCPDGQVSGLGVLQGYRVTKPVKVFYGMVENGHLKEGVIEADGGYMAGKFEGDAYVPTSDRNVMIHAFDVAAEAAEQMSLFFKEKNNQKLADEYAEKAEKLREQMD